MAALDKDDLTTQWMAHHLAERMENLKSLQGPQLREAEKEVAQLVLGIWDRRVAAIQPEDPVALVRSVERGVARLDPERPRWGYYGGIRHPESSTLETSEVGTAIAIAELLDRTVGDLIHALMRYAAISAADAEQEWISTVSKAGADPLERVQKLIERRSIRLRDLTSPDDEKEPIDPLTQARSDITNEAKEVLKLVRSLAKNGDPEPAPVVQKDRGDKPEQKGARRRRQ